MTAETVFVIIGMYNPIRLIMTLFVPFAVQMSTESKVTIDRLQVRTKGQRSSFPLDVVIVVVFVFSFVVLCCFCC